MPYRAMRSNSSPSGLPDLREVLLDLERDQVAEHVVGQVERVRDHVRVDAGKRESFPPRTGA